jgi:hypothetical protein
MLFIHMHDVYLFGHILYHYTGVYGNNVLQNTEICKAGKHNSIFSFQTQVVWDFAPCRLVLYVLTRVLRV